MAKSSKIKVMISSRCNDMFPLSSKPQIRLSDLRTKMKKEIEGTRFTVKGSSIKGETATLKVLRQKGEDSETGEIAFVRENGEWKMLPPQ